MEVESLRLQQTYAALAARIPNLFCCGRLGDFRYYNMDQALNRALETARAILEKSGGR
jgi:UDP-galactopyranose mutase